MTDDPMTPESEPAESTAEEAGQPPVGDTIADAPELEDAGNSADTIESASSADEPEVDTRTDVPPAPQAPESAVPTGQRRTTRHTHTTITRSESETTVEETSTTVEDVELAPPVYAAPTSGHPWPVG